MNNNGIIIPSGIKVSNTDKRTANETAFIASIPQSEIREKGSALQRDVIQSRMAENAYAPQSAVIGTRKVLCILIGFTDVPFSRTQAEFNNLMNQVGYSANSARGSIRDYYSEVSYGQLNLDVTVAGPYIANNSMAYYGADSYNSNGQLITRYIRARELITEAVQKANPDVNYADYDSDGDGYVDGIHVIFAGYDQAAGGPSDAIWSHKWQISKIRLDNKWVQTYSCSSELRGNVGTTISTIGTACHEFGHVLGAPDFYDINRGEVSDGDFEGTGRWDLMAQGSWNGSWGAEGDSPAHINPYTRINTFGWATAKDLPSDNTLVTLYPANSNSDSFYKIPTPTPGEYFLVENRQRLGFDASLPGRGMIVWHVHKDIESDSRAINITHPQRLYPLCASTTQNPASDPVSYGVINSGGCPFPGTSNKRSLTYITIPSLRSWAWASTGKEIQFITENGNNITFVVNPQISGPPLVCDQATYTIKNLSPGATVQWNVNNSNLILVSIPKEDSVIFKKSGDGKCTITAEITYPGTRISIPGKDVGVGLPDYTIQSVVNWGGIPRPGQRRFSFSAMMDDGNTLEGLMASDTNMEIEWYVTGGTILSGQGGYKVTAEVQNLSFEVYLTLRNSCGIIDTHTEHFDFTDELFSLYPNPATDIVTVKLKEKNATNTSTGKIITTAVSGEYEIQLWNASAMLKKVITDQPVYQISVSGLPAGIYFVRVIKDKQIITKKLIKR